MTERPGWYPDPFGLQQLRWWDSAWTSHVAVRRSISAAASGALGLGVVGFVMICMPIIGVVLSIGAVALGVRAVHRNRDDNSAVVVLSINAFILSLAVAGLAWSVMTGLYGIVISPTPA